MNFPRLDYLCIRTMHSETDIPHDPQISATLIEWYAAHRRELPWRETADPYLIWISEVILQQTRVAQGTDYYLRFTGRFPDVRTLAAASPDEVLRHWQGLGYYSRARNLHAAARQVAERFGGIFPATYEEVRGLPGIGDYTAAAVCSIARGLPHAAVDGNVYRVLARLFDIDLPVNSGPGQRYFAQLAAALLDVRRPGTHNQAMMEFGALQCVPRSPDCAACPLAGRCLALAHGRVASLPAKIRRQTTKARYFNYLDLRCGGRTALVRRTGDDIWKGLYEYPLIETESPAGFAELQQTEGFRTLVDGNFNLAESVTMPAHALSHRVIHARFHRIETDRLPATCIPVAIRDLDGYPVSRLTELYRER